jgi:hypothetical protein
MDVAYYNANRGIASPLIEHGDIVCGFWMCGNDYHNKSPLYGAYPPCYLPRMKLLFPEEFEKGKILHLFSGSINCDTPAVGNDVFRVDIKPHEILTADGHIMTTGPDIIGYEEEIDTMFDPGTFDLILADPPYDDNHLKYGTEKVNKKKVIKASTKALRVGGFLVWLDTIMPIWAKADGWKLRGTIGLLQSTNHKVRVISILEKVS